jgi:hypothetical protein
MADAQIIQTIDALVTHLESVLGDYPALANVTFNAYDDPDKLQWPLLDIHPAGLSYDTSNPAHPPEQETARLTFMLEGKLLQYKADVAEMFNIVDALRRALNTNACAIACGVAWIRMIRVDQLDPSNDDHDVFLNIAGEIETLYTVEAH